MTLDSSSSKRIVHLECPSGMCSQDSSISRASAHPLTLRLALSKFMFLLTSVTVLKLPFMYFATVLVIVVRQTSLDFARFCTLLMLKDFFDNLASIYYNEANIFIIHRNQRMLAGQSSIPSNRYMCIVRCVL